jgi:hypothetical protein
VGGEVKLDTVDVGLDGWVGGRIKMENCPYQSEDQVFAMITKHRAGLLSGFMIYDRMGNRQ